jgi:hypothetical protein
MSLNETARQLYAKSVEFKQRDHMRHRVIDSLPYEGGKESQAWAPRRKEPTLGEEYGKCVYLIPVAWLSGLGTGVAYMLNWFA